MAGNVANLKPFVKGDPRVNRAGRPKVFDELRKLSVQLAHEPALDAEGNAIIRNGHKMTVAEQILWTWAHSGDFQKQNKFLEICFGRVPNPVEFSGPDGDPLYAPIAVVSAINWQALSDDELRQIADTGRR